MCHENSIFGICPWQRGENRGIECDMLNFTACPEDLRMPPGHRFHHSGKPAEGHWWSGAHSRAQCYEARDAERRVDSRLHDVTFQVWLSLCSASPRL